jgi:hypothetical protein
MRADSRLWSECWHDSPIEDSHVPGLRGLKLHDLTLDPIGHLNAAGHREAAAALVSALTQPRPE